MPKCIAKMTLVLSDENGNCPHPPFDQYEEWAVSGGGVVGNVRQLMAYEYQILTTGRVGVMDDVYLDKYDTWSNKTWSMMNMTPECFRKYFVPID